MVYHIIPGRCSGSLQGEGVGVNKDSQSLNPSIVPCSPSWTEANEASIDLEIEVRDQAEMLIFLPVEVEDNAIPTNEPWIQARSSRTVAICSTIYDHQSQNIMSVTDVWT